MQMLAHIHEVLTKFVATKEKWEMYEGGQGRRLLFGIVSTPEDLAKSPQLKARNWLTSVEHPELGEDLQYAGWPSQLSEAPWAIRSRPPLVGEHNREIFGDGLGVTEDEWKTLEDNGAV